MDKSVRGGRPVVFSLRFFCQKPGRVCPSVTGTRTAQCARALRFKTKQPPARQHAGVPRYIQERSHMHAARSRPVSLTSVQIGFPQQTFPAPTRNTRRAHTSVLLGRYLAPEPYAVLVRSSSRRARRCDDLWGYFTSNDERATGRGVGVVRRSD